LIPDLAIIVEAAQEGVVGLHLIEGHLKAVVHSMTSEGPVVASHFEGVILHA
jgi:hypothetical protein